MRPIAELRIDQVQGCVGLLADLDETITSRGRLTASAYYALERLHSAGLLVIIVTGRPAGWCDHIGRMWPVSAVIGENGAFYMKFDRHRGRLIKRFFADQRDVQPNRARLDEVGKRILRKVPGAALASDQPYRETDLAIDYCEDVTPLGTEDVGHIVRLLRQEGLTAKVSSIHVNAWFGAYDKLSCARFLLQQEYALDLDQCKERFIFIGDSPNDAPMFAFFPLTVGVANVRDFIDQMDARPTFVTEREAGAGFVEMTNMILRHPRQ